MASSSNGNGNLMDDFEEAFQACLHAMTKKECALGVTKEEIELNVQLTASKFIDVARQMEAFFLQKRFLVSSLKPDMLLKDENTELKNEIKRKDDLINKHYSSLEEWKSLLSDMQPQHIPKTIQTPQNEMRQAVMSMGNSAGMSSPMPPAGQMGMMGVPGMNAIHQQQHIMQSQQQHAQQIHAQQMHAQMQMGQQVGPQPMHPMQQGIPFPNRPGPTGFNQNASLLPGPLAYLEKTTSNIDMAGMTDGRR